MYQMVTTLVSTIFLRRNGIYTTAEWQALAAASHLGQRAAAAKGGPLCEAGHQAVVSELVGNNTSCAHCSHACTCTRVAVTRGLHVVAPGREASQAGGVQRRRVPVDEPQHGLGQLLPAAVLHEVPLQDGRTQRYQPRPETLTKKRPGGVAGVGGGLAPRRRWCSVAGPARRGTQPTHRPLRSPARAPGRSLLWR